MSIIIFSILYAIKGGWLWNIPKAEKLKCWLTDGTQLSSILAGLYVGYCTDPIQGILFGLAWWVGVMVSMGEEAGSIGHYKGWWGGYKTRGFDRSYGIKKSIQRGIFLGSLLTIATNETLFIIAGATFPVCYFLGSSLHLLIEGKKSTYKDSWALAEPLYGAVIGIAVFLYLGK